MRAHHEWPNGGTQYELYHALSDTALLPRAIAARGEGAVYHITGFIIEDDGAVTLQLTYIAKDGLSGRGPGNS